MKNEAEKVQIDLGKALQNALQEKDSSSANLSKCQKDWKENENKMQLEIESLKGEVVKVKQLENDLQATKDLHSKVLQLLLLVLFVLFVASCSSSPSSKSFL